MVADSRRAIMTSMPIFEEGEGAGEPLCSRCGRLCERFELEECPICKRLYCTYCAYKIGSRSYCGRPCGDSFFFGGDVDEDGLSEE